VSGPLTTVRDFFVAPPGHVVRPETRTAAPSPSFVVLGDRRDVVPVACGLALAGGAGCGLVAVWPGEDLLPRLPAARAARRLAARLGARGLTAVPSGRLARVGLPADPTVAVAAAQRAVAAADVPAAVAVAGPRGDELDALLVLQDAVVLALRTPADDPLVRVATAGLAELGVPVAAVRAPVGLARKLATAGLVSSPALRAALQQALEAPAPAAIAA
jgi:hypothetical protein